MLSIKTKSNGIYDFAIQPLAVNEGKEKIKTHVLMVLSVQPKLNL